MKEFQVVLSDGTVMKGCHWEAEAPKANFCMITGMNEHASRYDPLAKYLNENGIEVYIIDALGQGLNAKSVEEQEQWPVDGFAKNVEGVALMVKLAKENGLPVTQAGHSMGSFLTQRRLQDYPELAEKTLIIGSNGGQGLLMKGGYLIAKMKVKEKNWNEPCKLLDDLGLGGYTKAIKDRKEEFEGLDWLSYDEDNIRAYIADPYCGHKDTGGFWKEFLKGMSKLWDGKAMKKVSPKENIFIIAGAEDPVGQNGKGPKWLEKKYKALGVEKVALKLYPNMRHEIHNEKGKMEVYEDIKNFILG